MKIVIVGDGKVGETLAKRLSTEGHNLVVVDNNAEILKNTTDTLDVIGVVGNGASYDVQKEAGMAKADLVIAATSQDELNMLACMFAKKLGAKHTIARVRNPEYYGQLHMMKEDIGLSMVINPELEAANEIARILKFPSALKIEPFVQGNVELVEVPVKEGSPMEDTRLSNLEEKVGIRVLVCAVQRKEDVFIPSGDFVLRAGDHIHITAPQADMLRFFKQTGLFKEKIRSVMIIGGGRIGYYLTRQLMEMGMQVKLIDKDEERCMILSEAFPKATVIHGDGTDQDILQEEGIDSVDAFVALTGNDEENIIISMYANALKVNKVITKINRISFFSLLGDIGIDSIVSPKYLTADQILRYVRAMKNSFGSNNIETLHKMVGDEMEALEFHVKENAFFTGVPLKNLELKGDLLIACIFRNGRSIIPGGNDTIEAGDRVIVVTSNKKLNDLSDILK